MLIDGLVWVICALLLCFYQLFGCSFWRHPFAAEDPIVSKYYTVLLYFSNLFLWWNKLIYILDDLRVSTFSKFELLLHYIHTKQSCFYFSFFTKVHKMCYLQLMKFGAGLKGISSMGSGLSLFSPPMTIHSSFFSFSNTAHCWEAHISRKKSAATEHFVNILCILEGPHISLYPPNFSTQNS